MVISHNNSTTATTWICPFYSDRETVGQSTTHIYHQHSHQAAAYLTALYFGIARDRIAVFVGSQSQSLARLE